MNDVGEFLAHAIRLESEAAARLGELADSMKTYGNLEVEAFFRKMAGFARMHLAAARARAGWTKVPELEESRMAWAEGDSPEGMAGEAQHYLMTVDYALKLALEGEERAFAFYDQVAKVTEDPEVRALAEEFAAEETEHADELRRWIARQAETAP